jgi:hypothetical protein
MFSLFIDADEKSRELLSVQMFKKGIGNHHTFSGNSKFSKALDSKLLLIVVKTSFAKIRTILISFNCADNVAINSQPEPHRHQLCQCTRAIVIIKLTETTQIYL